MTIGRFRRLSRQLFRAAPLASSATSSCKVSSYSARRILPSIADALRLDPADRSNVGVWSGGARVKQPDLTMPNMYSEFRLQAVAASRTKVLTSMREGLQSYAARMGRDTKLSRCSLPGLMAGALLQWTEVAQLGSTPGSGARRGSSQGVRAVRRASSVASSVVEVGVFPGRRAGSASGDSHAGHLRWVLAGPSRGGLSRLHLLREEGDGLICCGKALRSSIGSGVGLEAAGETGADWSPRCRAHARRWESMS